MKRNTITYEFKDGKKEVHNTNKPKLMHYKVTKNWYDETGNLYQRYYGYNVIVKDNTANKSIEGQDALWSLVF